MDILYRGTIDRVTCELLEVVNYDMLKKMQENSDFELLLEELAARFVNFSMEKIGPAITDVQRTICESLEFDRSFLWLFNQHEPGKILRSHSYGSSGDLPQDKPMDVEENFPWIFHQVRQGEAFAVENPDTLPQEALRDRDTLKKQGVKLIIVVPMLDGGSVFGALTFCCLREKTTWRDATMRRLQLIAQIFSNALRLKYREEEIQERLRFESLVAEISARFVNLSVDQLDSKIEDAQKSICQCLGLDLSALWQWSGETPHFLTVTHLFAPPEGPSRPEEIDAERVFPWVLKRVLRGETLTLYTENMPPEARQDQESRRYFGIKSSVVLPLCAGNGSIIGALSFDTIHEEKPWPRALVDRLNLVAQIFTNALSRKRGELKLRENEERLRLVTSAAGMGLWIMDICSRYVWATPETRDLFQFKAGLLLNYANFMERIIGEDRGKVDQAVEAAIQTGEAFELEFRIALPDGSVRWISSSGALYYGDTGEPARLMGISVDSSRRKQMEEQLETQLEEIKMLKQELEAENMYLQQKIEVQYVHEDIIARSAEMQQVLSQVEQVSQTDATVLIEGETGTGKELIARAVHRLSSRRARPLVTVNCASLPPSLVESELFGREKGAYTGALTKMIGRFEVADRATLFLDEVGELPMEIQAKLLRVLEQGSFERLGSTQTIRVDVRIIAATNKNLAEQVAVGKFRKDLFFRLNIFPIHLPPLRARVDDIPSLAWAFIREYEKKMGKRIDSIPRKSMEDMLQYHWSGNIRELRNVIERSLIACKGRTLQVRPPREDNNEVDNNLTLEEIERRHIFSVLQRTGWRISGKGSAAGILGLKRTTLQSKMKKLGIQRPASAAE